MLAKNLKYLRKSRRISQADLAAVLGLKRTTLGDYERATSNPSLTTLLEISSYFDVTIDQLLKDKIYNDQYTIIDEANQKILAISVDTDNNNLIDLVQTKAEAGYLSAYNDPEYIRELPKISIPNLDHGTFRAFEINGDSMLPILSGSIIICSYVESIKELKNNKTYIIISKQDGLVYKRVKKDIVQNRLILSSDNETYLPYDISMDDIDEIWQYYAHITFSDDKPLTQELQEQLNTMEEQLSEMKGMLKEIL